MGADVYCLICGGTLFNSVKYVETNEEVKLKKYEWLEKVWGIDKEENRISLDKMESGDWGNYSMKKGMDFFVAKYTWHFKGIDNYGMAAHKDCVKLMEKEMGYSIRFVDVCDKVDDRNLMKGVNYGEMKKYQSQWFLLDEAFEENRWLLESPLKNERNRERIMKMWEKMMGKLRRNKPRPSPCESAMVFKRGEIMRGYDGNLWIINENNGKKRWIIYEKQEKLEKKEKKVTKEKDRSGRPSPSSSATLYEVGVVKKGNDGNKWAIVKDKNGVKRWKKV